MRMLMINYEFPPIGGGAGRATWHLCQHLAQMGVGVDVLTSAGGRGHCFPLERAEVHALPVRRSSMHETGTRGMIEFLLRGAVEARRLIAARDYDLIHYFFSVPTGLLSFIVGHSLPYVVSLRGGDVPGYAPGVFEGLHKLLKPVNRLIWRRAAAVIALSYDLGETARRIEPKLRFEVIYNGVDTDLFRPLISAERKKSRKRVQLLCVARLLEWKGIQYLLDAVAQLRQENIHLTIVGAGPYEQELKKVAEDLSLEDIMTFAGPQPHRDLPAWYNKADIFVLPSYGDSFGQVHTEAMACGLPIVAARSGGVQEFVENGVNGFLVEPRDAGALLKPLRQLIGDPALRRRIGERNAQKMQAEFSWRGIAAQYRAVYESCLTYHCSSRGREIQH